MNKKEKEKILQKIKIAMAENNITQTDLAKELGLTQSAISYWFKGRGTPNIQTLSQIANILKKPINYFFAEVNGNNNAIGHRASATPPPSQDIQLLQARLTALESRLEVLELKINLSHNK